jgi:5-(carboxyamino)imidazole ribonucleotide mutase
MSELVAVILGSDSDLPLVSKTISLLEEFGVGVRTAILSAHRTPEELFAFVGEADKAGVKVFIAAAGMAAHLAGAVAARTLRPVIGVPIPSAPFEGLDSLLSTVQMPGGIPVATVGAGPAGAKNAALLALQILALGDSGLEKKLAEARSRERAQVLEKNRRLKERGHRDYGV